MKAFFDVVPTFPFKCIMMSRFVCITLHFDVIVNAHFLRPRVWPLQWQPGTEGLEGRGKSLTTSSQVHPKPHTHSLILSLTHTHSHHDVIFFNRYFKFKFGSDRTAEPKSNTPGHHEFLFHLVNCLRQRFWFQILPGLWPGWGRSTDPQFSGGP